MTENNIWHNSCLEPIKGKAIIERLDDDNGSESFNIRYDGTTSGRCIEWAYLDDFLSLPQQLQAKEEEVKRLTKFATAVENDKFREYLDDVILECAVVHESLTTKLQQAKDGLMKADSYIMQGLDQSALIVIKETLEIINK